MSGREVLVKIKATDTELTLSEVYDRLCELELICSCSIRASDYIIIYQGSYWLSTELSRELLPHLQEDEYIHVDDLGEDAFNLSGLQIIDGEFHLFS